MDARTSLHADDIVASKVELTALAVVERTALDIDTHAPFPGEWEDGKIQRDRSISKVAFRQFMKDGVPPKDTVMVRWRDWGIAELLPTSTVVLVDRSLLIGDIVKRHAHDAMSGCVLNTFTKCNLQPMYEVTWQNSHKYKAILPPAYYFPASSPVLVSPEGKPAELTGIPAAELTYADTLSEDDLVIYQDWIGKVETVDNVIWVRLSDNCVVEIADHKGEHMDDATGSFSIGDLVKSKKGTFRLGTWIYGQYNPNTSPVGTVVRLRLEEAKIIWLEKRIGSDAPEPPQILGEEERESSDFQVYDRTRRPKLFDAATPTISNSEPDIQLNLRVRFKDFNSACLKYGSTEHPIPKHERSDNLGFDLNVFDVTTFHTEVNVQWQDLSITTEKSIDLVPDGSIDDEHAAWPGEIAHTLGLRDVPNLENVTQPDRVGVVQSVNAEERMAKVKWSPESYVHYSKDPDEGDLSVGIVESRISNVSPIEEEVSLYDIEAPAEMNVRRGDIVMVAHSEHNRRPDHSSDMTWLGEIVDTRLDGTLVVRLGAAAEVKDVVLRREETVVAVRSDGTEQVDTWPEDEVMTSSYYDDTEDEMSVDGDDRLDSWVSGAEEEVAARYEDENGALLDESDVENEEWESADEDNEGGDLTMQEASEQENRSTSAQSKPDVHSTLQSKPESATETTSEAPQPYEILEGEVPPDHQYSREPPTSTPAHTKRTQKEHKILRNADALPGGVYIRTWETRLDLLRVLLIGPSETPYAHAPFVVDVHLSPQFPSEPPQLFFHSWPAHASIGSLGKVNPNLYEDGKICLSLLGTWEGGQGESWTPGRSTLFQVIVSLLGLVLVPEPYYNEAGYESLVGSEASKRPSALYTERVFLRAKGFLVTALSAMDSTPGLSGLHEVLQWVYRNPDGPRLLHRTIDEVGEVLANSNGSSEPDGLRVMSKGAAIPAKRLFDRLSQLVAE